jgi:hypothetical protein
MNQRPTLHLEALQFSGRVTAIKSWQASGVTLAEQECSGELSLKRLRLIDGSDWNNSIGAACESSHRDREGTEDIDDHREAPRYASARHEVDNIHARSNYHR